MEAHSKKENYFEKIKNAGKTVALVGALTGCVTSPSSPTYLGNSREVIEITVNDNGEKIGEYTAETGKRITIVIKDGNRQAVTDCEENDLNILASYSEQENFENIDTSSIDYSTPEKLFSSIDQMSLLAIDTALEFAVGKIKNHSQKTSFQESLMLK